MLFRALALTLKRLQRRIDGSNQEKQPTEKGMNSSLRRQRNNRRSANVYASHTTAQRVAPSRSSRTDRPLVRAVDRHFKACADQGFFSIRGLLRWGDSIGPWRRTPSVPAPGTISSTHSPSRNESDFEYATNDRKQEGFVPSSYIRIISGQEKHDREEAERLVLRHGLPRGSFLVRFSESKDGDYSLTVRNCKNEQSPRVENYRIERLDSRGATRWRVVRKRNSLNRQNVDGWETLDQLVRHHIEEAHGLCCALTLPIATLGQSSNTNLDRSTMTELASGNFGKVYKGTWNGMTVAVKKLKDSYTDQSRQEFLNERNLLTNLPHPHIVRFLHACFCVENNQTHMLLVTEFMQEGSLLAYVQRYREEGRYDSIHPREFLLIAAQVACGMAHLEDKGVIHRDLAARNVLLGCVTADVPIVKVADFGLARCADEYSPRTSTPLPLRWLAPECNPDGKLIFTSKSDVWSFGLVLFEMYSYGKKPFDGTDLSHVGNAVRSGRREEQPMECPDEVFDLMKQCWEAIPEARPSFADLTLALDKLALHALEDSQLHYSKYTNSEVQTTILPDDQLENSLLL